VRIELVNAAVFDFCTHVGVKALELIVNIGNSRFCVDASECRDDLEEQRTAIIGAAVVHYLEAGFLIHHSVLKGVFK